MYARNILLKDFRNFDWLNMEVSPGINILYGDNAQGKTNFIESIYFCSKGRSHRTNNDSDLIQRNKDEAHIQIIVSRERLPKKESMDVNVIDVGYTDRIDVHLKSTDRKGVAINGLPLKKYGEMLGVLLTVIFSPEDLQLIKSSPAVRRKFMDMEICQLSSVYYYELQQYFHVMKQRNNLLKNIKTKRNLNETLFVWDEQLFKHGVKIFEYRSDFIERLNVEAGKIYSVISDNMEELNIKYKPNVNPEDFLTRLEKNAERDILLGSTSSGIHKDDFSFTINGEDTRVYGSQGQQRTACLCAKLAEIELIKASKNVNPILILDDVFSELDEKRQRFLMEKSLRGVQTFITCTGIEEVMKKISDGLYPDISIFEVKKGEIKNVSSPGR